MKREYRVALIGATGLVGKEILRLLQARNFPIASLTCIASANSAHDTLQSNTFDDIDIAFFAATNEVSKEWIPRALDAGTTVIDNSSAFRDSAPLIIPEINREAIGDHRLLCSPNCTTTIMCMLLDPIHRHFGIKRVVAATYQAISGAGRKALEDFVENKPLHLYLHNSALDEEKKMREETRKILSDPNIAITATCVRVPILRVHSIALNIECVSSFSLVDVTKIIRNSRGVTLQPFATTADATGREEVICSRVRRDTSQKNGLDLWVLGDQLLKGAALNAVQIAEELYGIHARTRGESSPLCSPRN